jgi:hypothetical protein
MKGKYHVYIIEKPSRTGQKKQQVVRPGVASADRDQGDKKLWIRNTTDYPATIHFDANTIEAKPLDRLIAANDEDYFDLKNARSGFFEYKVSLTMGGTDVPVEGESAPGMIIDP